MGCCSSNNSKKTLHVEGMSCQHCAMSVKKALADYEAIKDVAVDVAKGEVVIDYQGELDLEKVRSLITEAGYEVK